MTATTNPQFNDSTEAKDVAKAFASQVHGKTVLITGVNIKGIGFATAEAFVCFIGVSWKNNADTSHRLLSLLLGSLSQVEL